MDRPKIRGDCINGPRPCPWVGCRYNLFLDVNSIGRIRPHFSKFEDMKESCALDVADKCSKGLNCREVGKFFNQSFQCIEVAVLSAFKKLRQNDLLKLLFEETILKGDELCESKETYSITTRKNR